MNLTSRTLLEQMQITPREIAQRKALFDFTDEDVAVLTSLRPLVEPDIDLLVEMFYDKQTSHDEVALVIGDKDTLTRLKGMMHRYVLDLFSGYYGEDYVNKRLRVGKVHQRIGVTPKLYMSAIRLMQETLIAHIERAYVGEPGSCVRCRQARASLNKLMLFDSQLVFDTYIGALAAELEAAREQVTQYAHGLEEKVAERTRQLEELSMRDPLTGLFNQRAFFDHLYRELAAAERTGAALTLVYMDLNGFKAVNDEQGHQAGDRILEEVGRAVRKSVRAVDIACRYGGDEFCLILPRTALGEAERVCDRVAETFDAVKSGPVHFSMGLAQTGPGEYVDMNRLVRVADHAMYEAKAASRGNAGHHRRGVSGGRAAQPAE